MASMKQKVDVAAQGVAVLAKEAGQAVGLDKGIAAVTVLETALAQAWVDVVMFRGANDTPERLNEAISQMQTRIAEEMRLQNYLRRGQKPN